MDSIKKKMMAMKLEKENALEKAINLENQLKEKAKDFEKKEEEMNDWLSKVKNIQTEVDTVQESLQEAISKLEETEKRATNAEAEVAAMTRRIRLLEEDFEQSSGRLTETSTKLDDASKAAEESERNRKTLETRSISDDERMAQLEEQVKEAKYIAEDAERKYDEASCSPLGSDRGRLGASGVSFGNLGETMKRIIAAQQTLATAEEKAQTIEVCAKNLEDRLAAVAAKLKAKEIAHDKVMRACSFLLYVCLEMHGYQIVPDLSLHKTQAAVMTFSKIVELEEELRIVGNNMKSLEVSEQESLQREESYEETIRDLTERLKTAEQRAAEAERQVSKLQNEVDRLEDELLSEKERYRAISGELDTTFAELTSF
ncbi:Tropomyosin [Echinococcus granulosus]|uniref:Tropomyosin n=1 Tax=Echinococcus granulosus TaxID=6210 RepID=W6UWX8_ECHGR|nr:Tropomyosin [Echinococcus granulosus]EUB63007.1 Tropomyosin [Echinococcus granulosus]